MPKGDRVDADPGLLLPHLPLLLDDHSCLLAPQKVHLLAAWLPGHIAGSSTTTMPGRPRGEVVCGFFCVVVILVLQLVLEQMVLMSSPLFRLLCLCLKATSSSLVLPVGNDRDVCPPGM